MPFHSKGHASLGWVRRGSSVFLFSSTWIHIIIHLLWRSTLINFSSIMARRLLELMMMVFLIHSSMTLHGAFFLGLFIVRLLLVLLMMFKRRQLSNTRSRRSDHFILLLNLEDLLLELSNLDVL